MIRRVLAIAAAALGLASGAQAASFDVPVDGTETYIAYWQGPCIDPSDPTQCPITTTPLADRFLSVTTPSTADGVYSDGVTLNFWAGYSYGEFFDVSNANASAPLTVSIVGGHLGAIYGSYEDAVGESVVFQGAGFISHFGGPQISVDIDASFLPAAVVPEPGNLALMGAALGVAGFARLRRSRKAAPGA